MISTPARHEGRFAACIRWSSSSPRGSIVGGACGMQWEAPLLQALCGRHCDFACCPLPTSLRLGGLCVIRVIRRFALVALLYKFLFRNRSHPPVVEWFADVIATWRAALCRRLCDLVCVALSALFEGLPSLRCFQFLCQWQHWSRSSNKCAHRNITFADVIATWRTFAFGRSCVCPL